MRKKVIVIGIDGARPDSVKVAKTPNMDKLISNGIVSYEGLTTCVTISGPAWSSILTGVWEEKHLVDPEFTVNNYAKYPTFLRRLKAWNPDLFTASIVNWDPINTNICYDADFRKECMPDAEVTRETVKLLTEIDPDAIFIQLDDVDGGGHTHGYGPDSAGYLESIEWNDSCIGEILQAIEDRPQYSEEDWLIIVVSDHGGIEKMHGPDVPECRVILFIANGKSLNTSGIDAPVNVVDVAPTVMSYMGMPIDKEWDLDGNPVGVTA